MFCQNFRKFIDKWTAKGKILCHIFESEMTIFIVSKHSWSLQKMLTALFNLVWNTQKSKWTILFECQGKMFLSIEKVLEKINEDQP